ncbi:MAG TPA: polysaccharide deacetylase family protein [Candidatus Binatia bacterium]|nr:polysaccharide deacetylase family protein [Candidatus Binatia bacterium]
MRPLVAGAALIVVAALGYFSYREYVHAGTLLTPGIITRGMEPHRALYPGIDARVSRLLRGPALPAERPKLIALTFDDGPYPVATPLLLDALHDAGIRATFFLIGRDAQQFPELTRRIVAAGHEIANHTLTHPDLDRLDETGVRAELDGGARALGAYTNDPAVASMMRPPHGRYTVATVEAAHAAGYDVMLWTDDPGDWRTVTSQGLARHIEAYATQPDIVLLHSGKLATIEMLPRIIERFRAAGYSFVTAGELLQRAGAAAINDPAKHPL